MARRQCTAKTKKGARCKAVPRKDTGLCNAHSSKEVQESAGFGGAQPGAGRPRRPRPTEILRERIEADVDAWLKVLEDAREADRVYLVWTGDSMDVHVDVDHRTRLRAFREAFDRAYGRPVQPLEHGGTPDQPLRISHELLTDPGVRERLGALKRGLADSRAERTERPGAGDGPAPAKRSG